MLRRVASGDEGLEGCKLLARPARFQNIIIRKRFFEALQQYWGDQLEKPEVLRRMHKNVGVEGRFLSLPIDAYSEVRTWGEANDHWIRTAQELGHCAISRAATAAGPDVCDIGARFLHVLNRHLQSLD
jgi:predicted naringenin-chalcone synthase